MTAEEWRRIPGFPDYEASTLGRIASVKRGFRQVLQGGKTDTGYRNVLLYSGGVRLGRRIHSLIALTFYGPRPAGLEIRHLDGDQLNNAVRNLRYGTHEENMADRRRHRGLLLIVGVDPTRRPRPYDDLRCRHGHERTEANTYVYPDGKQVCRPCKSKQESESRTRRALAAANVRSAAA